MAQGIGTLYTDNHHDRILIAMIYLMDRDSIT